MTLVCHLLQVGNGALIFGYIFLAFHEGHPTWLFAIYVVSVFLSTVIQVSARRGWPSVHLPVNTAAVRAHCNEQFAT
jgi:hypothetical protein